MMEDEQNAEDMINALNSALRFMKISIITGTIFLVIGSITALAYYLL